MEFDRRGRCTDYLTHQRIGKIFTFYHLSTDYVSFLIFQALQIFSVLRKVGKQHSFSAGLVIGGKDVDFEKERIGRMNILVCTPGRLLQHMDETVDFDCSKLQVLGKFIAIA